MRAGGAAAAVSLRLGVACASWGERQVNPVRGWDRVGAMRQVIERRRRSEVPEGIVAARAGELVGTAGNVTRWPRRPGLRATTWRRAFTATGSAARRWSGSWPGWARCPSPTVDGCRVEPGRADVMDPGIAIAWPRWRVSARAPRGAVIAAPRRHSARAARGRAVGRATVRATLSVIDYHTEGEPMRFIVATGVPRVPGASSME